MIRGTTGHVAHQLETVAGILTRPLYSNKNLFVVDGAPGVWRQVADPKVTDPSDRAIVYAAFGGGKISLTPDVLINAEFELAGFGRAVEGALAPELAAVMARARELAAANPPTLLTAAAVEAGDEAAAAAATAGVRPADPAAAPKPRKRAAGSVITSSSPEFQIRDEAGELAPTSAMMVPPAAPPPPAVEHAPPESEDTGFAPVGDLEI